MMIIQFRDPMDQRYTYQWALEWPPPEQLWFYRDHSETMIAERLPVGPTPARLYYRVACQEETNTHTGIAPGALYVRDPERWDGES